jgi:hypothetical protein
VGHAQDASLVDRKGFEGLGQEARDRLTSGATGLDEPRVPQSSEMPRHERLAQPDVFDELGDAGFPVGEASDDPESVHVGEGLVDDTEATKLVGRIDDRRER